jgi:hypothetical protein
MEEINKRRFAECGKNCQANQNRNGSERKSSGYGYIVDVWSEADGIFSQTPHHGWIGEAEDVFFSDAIFLSCLGC